MTLSVGLPEKRLGARIICLESLDSSRHPLYTVHMTRTDERSEKMLAVTAYVEARDRMARLEAAEDRTFDRYMNGTGSAATARKAKSRVNAHSTELEAARMALYRIMDAEGDCSGDLDGFADRVLKGATR